MLFSLSICTVLSGTPAAKGFWKFVQFFINKFSLGQKECHKPKPILLDTGGKVVDCQLVHLSF